MESVVDFFEKISMNDEYQILTGIGENGNIVGCIYYYIAFPLMAFIEGFLPIIDKSRNPKEIALSLIEIAKKSITEIGHTRLEVEFKLPTPAHRACSEKYVKWYRAAGFQFAAEEVHMESDLTAVDLPQLDLPQGYQTRKFSEMPYELLETPGYQAFEDSKDGLFSSMSLEEQKITIQYFFDKSKPHIEDASLVLVSQEKVVGFVITREKDNEPEIGPIGLVPNARRKGLGQYLLVSALKALKDSGFANVTLDMSITNLPAKKLYRKFGFEDVYYKQFYYWAPEMNTNAC